MKESTLPDEAGSNNVEGGSEQTKTSSRVEGSSLQLEQTNSEKLFQHIIFTYFVPLEIWYTRTIVDKASGFMSSLYILSHPVVRHIGPRVRTSPRHQSSLRPLMMFSIS
jgi:hypothetical protein